VAAGAAVSDDFDAELDALFQLRPAEVVPARNALADRLKKAGDKPAAARVMAIKRPTPTAWAINQVHFRDPELLERASEHAARLRELHAADGVDGKQLAAAVEALRRATQQVVDAAMRHCEAAGLAGGPPQQRKVFSAVQSWLSGAAGEQPGRMTQDVEASGFDAIGSVGLVLPGVPLAAAGVDRGGGEVSGAGHSARGAKTTSSGALPAPGATSKPHERPEKQEPDPRVLAEATEKLAKREREARAAVERERERVTARKEAERELDRARLQVKDAERALVHLRAAQADREKKLAEADRELRDAEQDREQSEEAVVHARSEFAKLRGSKVHH
jgi:hypothetical protein